MTLFLLILLPIVLAITLFLLPLKNKRIWTIFVQLGLLIMAIFLFIQVDLLHEESLLHSLGAYNSKVAIHLLADPISALFVLLTTFLFLIVLLYAYHEPYLTPYFLLLFTVLEGLIIGIFLVQDLFSLYALTEVSTIVISILIMFEKDKRSIYDGLVYLLINIIAMSFFLVGIGYVYVIFGTLDFLQLKTLAATVDNPKHLILPYAFLITAVGLKSKVMPLFSWLPRAHTTPSAPPIVSAVLSALYVKSGLYIFLRIQDAFGSLLGVDNLFLILGFLTAIVAVVIALSQNNIMTMLAYSTVSQVGLIIFGLSLRTTYGYYGSIYHVVSHALFKATLFLCAGLIIRRYETRHLADIRGVLKTMPYTATIMIIAILGISGAPLFNGSISKDLIQKGLGNNQFWTYALILTNIGTMTYLFKLSTIFFGPKKQVIPIKFIQHLTTALLGILCFLGGVFGHVLVNLFFELDVAWSFNDYFEKLIIYTASLVVSYGFYAFIYPRLRLLKGLHLLELTFNELVFSMMAFFFGILSYLVVFV